VHFCSSVSCKNEMIALILVQENNLSSRIPRRGAQCVWVLNPCLLSKNISSRPLICSDFQKWINGFKRLCELRSGLPYVPSRNPRKTV
jgi:hypothetical protein